MVVRSRLQTYLDSNDMMPKTQSAYRPFHSTETALSKVYNDCETYSTADLSTISLLLMVNRSLLCVYSI